MGKAMKTLSPPVGVAITRKATLLECLLAAVASGALLAFALPPFDVPLLGFVALAPMMAAVLRASAIPALVSTLLTGIVAGTVMTAFLSGVGDGFSSPTLALAYFAVFGVAMWFPLMGARVLGAGRAGAIVLGVGALGVLTEWLAARLDYPFTLALVLWRDAPLLWVAGWVGVWGLSFLAWATNAALALAVMERRLNAPLKALVGGLLALHLLGWLQHALIREGETLRVAVVQWEGDYAPLIAQAKAQGAQLVVLPEACCSTDEGSRWARQMQVWLIFGAFHGGNAAMLAAPDGTLSEPYYKMYPFGSESPSWQVGDPVRAFPSPFGTLGAVICYDTMFTAPCRRQALNGARLIAVPTFDPYAPGYLLHHLHGATTTLRAAEHHVPLARSEYRAASMIVDAWGRVLAYAPPEAQLAIADVPLGSGRGTLASRVGDGYVLLCLLMAIGVGYIQRHSIPKPSAVA
jgi:apolipoprotein N-acyltransferase